MYRTIATVVLTAACAALPVLAAGGEKGDFEIGLFAGYGFPDKYGTTASLLNPENDLLYGIRLGYFLTPIWSLELSGQEFSSETRFGSSVPLSNVDFDIRSIRLNLLLNLRPEAEFRPFVTFGIGQETAELANTFESDDTGYNAGLGFRWYLTETFGIRLEGRYLSIEVDDVDNREHNIEATFGVSWSFGGGEPTDSDGDGVFDRRDDCPDTPQGATVDAKGCPMDSDGDGVFDGIDECPGTEAGVPVDAKGCPMDSDGDGVHDGIDKCPDTPAGARVDESGCPLDADKDGVFDGLDKCPGTPVGATVDSEGCPQDSDGDGVFDGIDKCPGTPKNAIVDGTGCPRDTDGDGVFDGIDQCPDTPKGTEVDAKGCTLLFEAERDTLVLEGVNFELDSADLTEGAMSILDRVAMSLNQWPEIRVEVGGHTDSTGSDAYNLDLSQRRAEAVRSYLMEKGADGSRITANGYGESSPIADNSTAEGRGENRRVELKKLD